MRVLKPGQNGKSRTNFTFIKHSHTNSQYLQSLQCLERKFRVIYGANRDNPPFFYIIMIKYDDDHNFYR